MEFLSSRHWVWLLWSEDLGFMAHMEGQGVLLSMTHLDEKKFWFLWLTLRKKVRETRGQGEVNKRLFLNLSNLLNSKYSLHQDTKLKSIAFWALTDSNTEFSMMIFFFYFCLVLKKQTWDRPSDKPIKLLLGTLTSLLESCLSCFSSSFQLMHLRREPQWLPTWALTTLEGDKNTLMSSWPNPGYCVHLESKSENERFLSYSLPLSVSLSHTHLCCSAFKWMNRNKLFFLRETSEFLVCKNKNLFTTESHEYGCWKFMFLIRIR